MIVYFIFDIFIILEEKQQLSVIGICFIFCKQTCSIIYCINSYYTGWCIYFMKLRKECNLLEMSVG